MRNNIGSLSEQVHTINFPFYLRQRESFLSSFAVLPWWHSRRKNNSFPLGTKENTKIGKKWILGFVWHNQFLERLQSPASKGFLFFCQFHSPGRLIFPDKPLNVLWIDLKTVCGTPLAFSSACIHALQHERLDRQMINGFSGAITLKILLSSQISSGMSALSSCL